MKEHIQFQLGSSLYKRIDLLQACMTDKTHRLVIAVHDKKNIGIIRAYMY